MSFVLLTFDCKSCNEIQFNFENDVFTTWMPNDGFICRTCYESIDNKNSYENVKISKYMNIMQNRPQCDKCNRQVITAKWLYCEKCNYDFCKRCNLTNCSYCDNVLVPDKYNFSD